MDFCFWDKWLEVFEGPVYFLWSIRSKPLHARKKRQGQRYVSGAVRAAQKFWETS